MCNIEGSLYVKFEIWLCCLVACSKVCSTWHIAVSTGMKGNSKLQRNPNLVFFHLVKLLFSDFFGPSQTKM
jgi:hypothetical protein